jgi:glycolate oxidase FAD binding subunit
VRFIDGHGDIIKNGGRVMKNVTGYDLVKLMCGAQGTLGVLSEVSFKVLPGVSAQATLSLPADTAEAAVAAMSAALGSPFEVSGAAWRDGAVLLRLEGFDAASVAYRVEAMRAALASFGTCTLVEAEASGAVWAAVLDVTDFADHPGDLWRISVRPSQAPGVVAALRAQQVMLDWGGGLIWARVAQGQDVRTALAAVGGHATRIKGTGAAALPPEAPGVAALTAGLRAQFDPRGLFSAVHSAADPAEPVAVS